MQNNYFYIVARALRAISIFVFKVEIYVALIDMHLNRSKSAFAYEPEDRKKTCVE